MAKGFSANFESFKLICVPGVQGTMLEVSLIMTWVRPVWSSVQVFLAP